MRALAIPLLWEGQAESRGGLVAGINDHEGTRKHSLKRAIASILAPALRELTTLIKDQYALLDGGRTDQILALVHDENYNANQLNDTLLAYTPFLSDDVLLALVFRNEFNGNKRSHLLIANAPHSNLIWRAIDESNVYINADSLDKLEQYQDSSSSRKYIIDSLSTYKLQKALNYSEMLYYVSIDTNLTIEEVKDSLADETDAGFRFLLADLQLSDKEYNDAKNVYDSLKVYFRQDEELIDLRLMQIGLFDDDLTYFDLDSQTTADIEQIAFNDTSVAAFQAMAILEMIRDTIYPKPFQDKEGGGGSKRGMEIEDQDIQSNIPEKQVAYKLIPTLIQGKESGLITIGQEEEGELMLFSIQGKFEGRYQLNEGVNIIPVGSLNLAPGIHLYRVYVNGEIKNADKIVKLR